ncbi:MAG: acyltransferase [Muribaculaceae bacterium]|nr:acyltransferase [Muribaculaceae bacterium]
MNMTHSYNRNISLDLIKVIAMTYVMLLHSVHAVTSNILCFVLATMSGIAIPLFFMVSGFLLIGKQKDWRYSSNKVVAILKLGFLLAFPIAVVRRIIAPELWLNAEIWVKELVGPYLQRHSVLWTLWYLGAMIFIYFALPLITKLYSKYGKLFLISGTMIFGVICNIFYTLDVTENFERGVYQTFRVYNWFLYFFLGGLLRAFMPEIKKRLNKITHSNFLILLPAILCACFYCLYLRYISFPYNPGVEYQFGSGICILYSIVTFISLYLYKPGRGLSRCIKNVSELFLPAFILHVFVLHWLYSLVPLTLLGSYTYILRFVIVYPVTLGISYIIMRTRIGRWIFHL